jgi:hypothetical protein
MESQGVYNSADYSAYSAAVHCPNGNDSNCANQTAVEPILGKYSR